MPETRKKHDREFRQGAVRIVEETGKSIAVVARDPGSTRAPWATGLPETGRPAKGTEGLSKGDIEELKRLRSENAELRMERDVLKRSVVLWVKEATK